MVEEMPEGIRTTILWVISIGVIALIILILSIIFNLVPNNSIPTQEILSSEQTVLTQSSATLTPIGERIVSLTATSNNQSWLEFDGVNDFIGFNDTIPSDLHFNDTTNFSWFIWIKPNSCGIQAGDIKAGLIGTYQRNAIQLDLNGSNDCLITGGLRNSTYSGDSGKKNDEIIVFQEWVFVGVTYDESTKNYTLIKDNTLQNYTLTVTNVTLTDSSIPYFRIGNERSISGGNPGFFDGSMDEVRIYNQTLTPAQITEIYNSGRTTNSSLPSDGLVLWYSFNEGTGTTVYDKSGNGNNGV